MRCLGYLQWSEVSSDITRPRRWAERQPESQAGRAVLSAAAISGGGFGGATLPGGARVPPG
jgi:hypothetical protein